MKFVPFGTHEDNYESRGLLVSMLKNAANGQNIGEMRERIKVLDRLIDAPEQGVTLEDAEHATLVRVINSSTFGFTSKGILAIVDSVIAAKPPAPPEKPEAPAA